MQDTYRYWEALWGDENSRPPWLVDGVVEPVSRAFADGWLGKQASVLDVGCGIGSIAAWLAERGLDVLGIDFSKNAVERARRAYGARPNLDFQVVDACRPNSLGRTFDAIIDRGCLHQLSQANRPGYVRNLLAWSHPGTRFLLMTHYLDIAPEMRCEQLRRMLGAEFDLADLETVPMEGPSSAQRILGGAFRLVRRSSRSHSIAAPLWAGRTAGLRARCAWNAEAVPTPVHGALATGWWRRGMSLLALHCGDGRSASWLADNGLDVLAIHPQPETLDALRGSLGSLPRLQLQLGDPGRPLSLGLQFDALLDCGGLAALPREQHAAYVSNAAAAARPGARFLLLVPMNPREAQRGVAALRRLFAETFDVAAISAATLAEPHSGKPVQGAALNLVRRGAKKRAP